VTFNFLFPYNINIIFTRNVIFDNFSIKRYILFILALYIYIFKLVPWHKLLKNFTFIDDYWLIVYFLVIIIE